MILRPFPSTETNGMSRRDVIYLNRQKGIARAAEHIQNHQFQLAVP